MVAMTMQEKHTPYSKKGVFTQNSMCTTRVPQLGTQTKSQHYNTIKKQELTISFTDALSMLGSCATASWLPFSSSHNLETDAATMIKTHTRTEDQNQNVSDDRGPVTKRECTRPPYQHHTSPLQKNVIECRHLGRMKSSVLGLSSSQSRHSSTKQYKLAVYFPRSGDGPDLNLSRHPSRILLSPSRRCPWASLASTSSSSSCSQLPSVHTPTSPSFILTLPSASLLIDDSDSHRQSTAVCPTRPDVRQWCQPLLGSPGELVLRSRRTCHRFLPLACLASALGVPLSSHHFLSCLCLSFCDNVSHPHSCSTSRCSGRSLPRLPEHHRPLRCRSQCPSLPMSLLRPKFGWLCLVGRVRHHLHLHVLALLSDLVLSRRIG